MKKFASDVIKARMPYADIRFVTNAFDLVGKVSIAFESDFLAKQFVEECADKPIEHESRSIRARRDQPQDVRDRNRVIGKLREMVHEDAKEVLHDGRFEVGSNNPKGKVFISEVATGRLCVLFTVTDSEQGGPKVTLNDEDIAAAGLDPIVAQRIAKNAEDACRRPARE